MDVSTSGALVGAFLGHGAQDQKGWFDSSRVHRLERRTSMIATCGNCGDKNKAGQAFQDERYGKDRRVFNTCVTQEKDKVKGRCTCCGVEKTFTEKEVN